MNKTSIPDYRFLKGRRHPAILLILLLVFALMNRQQRHRMALFLRHHGNVAV